MHISRSEFRGVYEEILARAQSEGGACSVLILVAPDADAVCACRIFAVSTLAHAVQALHQAACAAAVAAAAAAAAAA